MEYRTIDIFILKYQRVAEKHYSSWEITTRKNVKYDDGWKIITENRSS